MSSYFIANISIHDNTIYNKYLENAGSIFKNYNGRYLAVNENPEVLEGDWNYTKVVLIEFPTNDELKAWYNSPEYQEILKYRLEAATCDTIAFEGK